MGGHFVPPAIEEASHKDNKLFSDLSILIPLAVATLFFAINVGIVAGRRIRKIVCLNDNGQEYFRQPPAAFSFVKRHLSYAPLFRQNHAQRVWLGRFDVGQLPTRLQFLTLGGLIGMNIVFACYGIEWRHVPAENPSKRMTLLLHLRNRTGSLAVSNMLVLVLIGGRNNPLIKLLNIPFDTFNTLHRWYGRMVVAFSIVHSTCELISMSDSAKMAHMSGYMIFKSALVTAPFIMWGLVAWICFLTILVTSFSAFRHAFYETFFHIHFCLVALVLGALWLHLKNLPPRVYVHVSIGLWAAERGFRLLALLYRNVGLGTKRGSTTAQVVVLPGDALRITLAVARPWRFHPGQHVFLSMPTVGLWTNHPFSVAWSEGEPVQPAPRSEKPTNRSTVSSNKTLATTTEMDLEKALPPLAAGSDESLVKPTSFAPNTVSLVIRRRGGFTKHLHDRCIKNNGQLTSLPAYIEGPYGAGAPSGTSNSLTSYGTVVLFAAGIGITHTLPYARDLLQQYNARTTATRRVVLVWIVQNRSHLEWVRPWLMSLMGTPNREALLRVHVYLTQEAESRDHPMPRSGVQVRYQKPRAGDILAAEVDESVGATGVAVCGPGGLGDDVRAAVRRELGRGRASVSLIEEAFGW